MRIEEGKPTQPWERICVYGGPKSGKSRLVTSLPYGEKWGERAVYVAYDPGAEFLKSVLFENREKLLRVVPEGKPTWLEEAVEIATTDWASHGVKTLIWDTMSVTSHRLLRQYADSGIFSEKHAVQLGTRGKASWHTSPMEGDYGAVQNSIGFLLEHMWGQPLHLVVVFHDKWVEPKASSIEGLHGGPDVAGKKAVRWVPGRFDTVLRTELVRGVRDLPSHVIVHTQPSGIWVAGARGGTPLTGLPAQTDVQAGKETDFWRLYDQRVT